MRFNIANKAPVTVSIAGTDYQLPLMRRPFWVKWASELDAKRTAEATEGLSPMERAKLLLIYPIEPTMHADLTKRISTPEGTGRIILESAAKSQPPIPPAIAAKWLEESDERDLESLALILASVVDFAEQQEKAQTQEEGGAEPGPLPVSSSESGDSSKMS